MSTHLILLGLIGIFLSALVVAPIAEDEVKSLPGWNGPLKSKHYSGYLPVGNASKSAGMIHYWFIESENNPAKDPVVYWTNGGPGSSGISLGLLTELGQLHLNDDSFNSSELEVFYNPYSWSKVANMLFVSQPKGVGFSYCTDTTTKCTNNDRTSAQDAYEFFIAFFKGFPEYAKNDFYLTGESYGGIYIPLFMQEIDRNGGLPNFKGGAIGDGCWGTSVGLCAFSSGKSAQIQVQFFFGHSMTSQSTYKKIIDACGSFSDDDVKKAACSSAIDEMGNEMGDFDIYNVYDTCADDQQSPVTLSHYNKWLSNRSIDLDNDFSHLPFPQLGGALNDYKCGGERASSAWLKQQNVANALHVKSGTAGMHYDWGPASVSGDLRPLYKSLASKYRLMIYSGDTDGCVPEWGTEEWVRELGFEVKKGWRPWLAPLTDGAEPQRAGYVIDYDTNGFRLVTIQGAGHMVPTYKPNFALTMITKFLRDEPF